MAYLEKVFLIRHGSTAGNLEQRYVGTTDEPLTEEARRILEENREQYPRADVVFASPLLRCVQTAELLYPEKEIKVLPDLREIDFGTFEYKNYEELKDDPGYQAWVDSGGTAAFPGGESRETFCTRCCAAFLKACREAASRQTTEEKEEAQGIRAAFVVHGGTIMAVLDRYSEPHRDYFEWQAGNGEGFACTCLTQETQAEMRLGSLRPLPEAPALTGIEDQYVRRAQKKLGCGYTTGSCAAAAAKAAVQMLLSGRLCHHADLLTPKGIRLHLPVEEQEIGSQYASAAVRKYAGDDPDATDGVLVYARAEYDQEADSDQRGREAGQTAQISVDGGIGVGRVTKPGLEQPVGAAAINRVPREMIAKEAAAVCESYEYGGRVKITISVPEGAEIAKRTFNPHLGIEGGISILGTSGIVVPMSEEALIESIRVEMRQKAAGGEEYLLITPGNYGADFIRRQHAQQPAYPSEGAGENQTNRSLPDLRAEDSMKCSNYVGETLDIAEELGVKGILFVAHIGKFIKVSGGIMNTHSMQADCRAELMAAQAMRAGVPAEIVRRLLDTNTTEEAVGILSESGYLRQTMEVVTDRAKFYLQKHCRGALETEAILFSNQYGYLGETDGADQLVEKLILQYRAAGQLPE